MGEVALGLYVLSVFQREGIWRVEAPKEHTVLCEGYGESSRRSHAQRLWTGLQRAQMQELLLPIFVGLQARLSKSV